MGLGTFRDSLQELGDLCCRYQVAPVFMEFPPVDDERARRLGTRIGYLSNELIAPYNAAVLEHAQATDSPYVATWEAMSAGDPAKLQQYLGPDGVHQNTLGHRLLYELCSDPVDEAIRQSLSAAA